MPSKTWKKSFLKICLGNARVEIIELASMPYLCISKSGSKSFTEAIPFQLPVFLIIPANGKNVFKTNYILTVSKLISSKKISLEAVEVFLALNFPGSEVMRTEFWDRHGAMQSCFPVKVWWWGWGGGGGGTILR